MSIARAGSSPAFGTKYRKGSCKAAPFFCAPLSPWLCARMWVFACVYLDLVRATVYNFASLEQVSSGGGESFCHQLRRATHLLL